MPFLHPGKAAATEAGWVGELHPALLDGTWGVFELDLDELTAPIPERILYDDVITFPPLRQDIAVVVAEEVEAAALIDAALEAGAPELREARVFDVYRGEQAGEGRKSVAIHLSLQVPDRTLSDDDAIVVRERVVAALVERFGAELRGRAVARHAPRPYSVLPPTSHTGPWVSTLSVSERTRRTRVVPAIPFVVEALEAAPGHRRRDAVAGAARAAEREDESRAGAGRVERRAEERGAIEESARLDLELAEQVGPVRRTGARAPRPSCSRPTRLSSSRPPPRRRPGRGRRAHLHGGRFEVAPGPLPVEALEDARRRLGAVRPRGAADVEDERRADLAGVDRAEHLRRAGQIAGLLGREREPDVRPPLGQAGLDRAPLIDELHRSSA